MTMKPFRKFNQDVPGEIEQFSKPILDSAYSVHTKLGPGLMENIYELAMVHELEKRGVRVQRQVPLPVVYDGVDLGVGLKLDLMIEESIIVELKAVESILPVHEAQLMTYLNLAKKRLGFLMNFNVASMKDGIDRVVL
jgi:GxxExxY protein